MATTTGVGNAKSISKDTKAKTNWYLLALLTFLCMGDIATTLYGTSLGIKESNPILVSNGKLNTAFFIAIKIWGILLLLFLIVATNDTNLPIIKINFYTLIAFCIIYTLVIFNNLLAIRLALLK